MAFLGKILHSKVGNVSTSILTFNSPLLLYFSASWCPPCRSFTPILSEFYTKVNTPKKQCEIIFCTFDETKIDFDGYYAKMPWLTIPFEDKDIVINLAKQFEIESIPTLVLINEKGIALSKNCRHEVSNRGVEALYSFKLLLSKN